MRTVRTNSIRLSNPWPCRQPTTSGSCYVHSRVVRSRDPSQLDSPFLAELDLTGSINAQLVLGLNNHHVISYYWARSAGAGAAMEAPGVILKGNRLEWQGSIQECSSNDGKRSEWVNFLRAGDQVQLLPRDTHKAIRDLRWIFGVSTEWRPLGSEPAAVCEWKLFIRF